MTAIFLMLGFQETADWSWHPWPSLRVWCSLDNMPLVVSLQTMRPGMGLYDQEYNSLSYRNIGK